MSLEDTSWVQGSKVSPLLSQGEISFSLSQGPPAPFRQAPSSPKKQLEKDFTCQLPSTIKESFASLGNAGPYSTPRASVGPVVSGSPGLQAVSTTGPSCPPGREERNTCLCRRRNPAPSFPFIMKIPFCFLLSVISQQRQPAAPWATSSFPMLPVTADPQRQLQHP